MDDLEKRIEILEQENRNLNIVVAALAEQIRRLWFDVNSKPVELCPLGNNSFTIRADTPHQLPLKLSIEYLDTRTLRVNFEGLDARNEHFE